MDWSLPGFSVHAQAVGCHFLLQGSSRPRDWIHITCMSAFAGGFFPTATRVYFIFLFFLFIYLFFISWRLITLQYCSGFCHTLKWISHGFTCIFLKGDITPHNKGVMILVLTVLIVRFEAQLRVAGKYRIWRYEVWAGLNQTWDINSGNTKYIWILIYVNICIYTHTHTYICIYIIDTNTQKSIHGEYVIWRTITKWTHPQKHHPGQEVSLPALPSPLPVIVLSLCLATQVHPTPCDPMNFSPPGASVQGGSPGKNTGVGCHALLWGIDRTQLFRIAGGFFTVWATKEALPVVFQSQCFSRL